MNLLLTLVLMTFALALVVLLLRHLTGGLLPEQESDLAFLRNRRARKEARR
ncbi:hypothetical protein [Nocardiopsis quinghaiensis]|uniref:hypothetical protein n=1 Tax=Nocardiopsis quinghaiensis TaxID=464995 RepID=UPI00168007D5|nr:hypothetical protein [Nocardiopsis quinghaiensis]